MKFNFLGFVNRLKFIDRWSRMKPVLNENVAEHSFEVSVVAHVLALIKNNKYGGNVDANKVTTMAVFHDLEETIVSDVVSPTKHFSPETSAMFKEIERHATKKIIDSVGDEALMKQISSVFDPDHYDKELYLIVKSADIICQYIKAKYEYKERANSEFRDAYHNTREIMMIRAEDFPEVKWLVDHYVIDMKFTLDALLK